MLQPYNYQLKDAMEVMDMTSFEVLFLQKSLRFDLLSFFQACHLPCKRTDLRGRLMRRVPTTLEQGVKVVIMPQVDILHLFLKISPPLNPPST